MKKVKGVSKMHYEQSIDGINLRVKSDKMKERVRKNTWIKVKKGIISKREFQEELPFFNSGNDAVLQYTPLGDKIAKKKLFYANSSVSDFKNPFAYLRKYALMPLEKDQNFNWIHTNRKREIHTGTPRNVDTEFKLLEKLAKYVDSGDVGTIDLYTYYEPCLSCDYVIIQFTKKYPNIKVNVYFSEEYKPKKGMI
ncbi:hypothetical protein I6G54_10825 [Bacillus tropicus]|uniref:deaminase domain-containing protein n=1 Tax=Bacillus tropicus TaxID=2026188 RepID=UPI00130DA818|nr:deaminase domain-containing protein [Bacillus tropicus]QPS52504.1 hypothetical protein I6G54_10825 [Bacillus tropicus]